MAVFDYSCFDCKGNKKKGSMEASDQEMVISLLKADGKMPIVISEQSLLTKDVNIEFGKAVSSKDLAVFCRQFHSILSAGVSIVYALEMLGNETENKKLQKAVKDIKRVVEKGEQLSLAMSSQTNIFPPILINMVEAGEISGSFDVSMLRMAEHFEKEAKITAVIKKASIYPIILCFVSMGVILLMLVKVIPTFMGMFEDMNTKLPAVTMAVVHASNFAKNYWFILVAVILLIVIGIKVLKASEQGKELFSQLVLKLPYVGKLVVKSASARLGRTLSTLLSAGVSITQALEMTAKTMDNTVIKRQLYNAVTEVERGVPISYTLEATKTFPPMVSHLIRIGEQTGNTEVMLTKLAQYYEEEVETSTASLMTALEPLMIVVLAGIIGFLLTAMFQPMLTMYQGLNNL